MCIEYTCRSTSTTNSLDLIIRHANISGVEEVCRSSSNGSLRLHNFIGGTEDCGGRNVSRIASIITKCCNEDGVVLLLDDSRRAWSEEISVLDIVSF